MIPIDPLSRIPSRLAPSCGPARLCLPRIEDSSLPLMAAEGEGREIFGKTFYIFNFHPLLPSLSRMNFTLIHSTNIHDNFNRANKSFSKCRERKRRINLNILISLSWWYWLYNGFPSECVCKHIKFYQKLNTQHFQICTRFLCCCARAHTFRPVQLCQCLQSRVQNAKRKRLRSNCNFKHFESDFDYAILSFTIICRLGSALAKMQNETSIYFSISNISDISIFPMKFGLSFLSVCNPHFSHFSLFVIYHRLSDCNCSSCCRATRAIM